MKYIYTFFSMAMVAFLAITLAPKTARTNSTGAIEGNTGAPSETTCAQPACHGGTPTPITGALTSDIPATGYVPGSHYTITATISQTGVSRFGFQVSPQLGNGAKAGTMASLTSNTQIIGSGKYITHTQAGSSSVNSKVWTFTWTAPAAGSGPVTFYGAFLAANNNGVSDPGDKVFTSTMSASEEGALTVKDFAAAGVQLYPVPFTTELNLHGVQAYNNPVIKVYSLEGKLVLQENITGNNATLNTAGLSQGFYIVKMEAGNTTLLQKVSKM